jgi:UDP-N-acetylglucosamine acyltransferase
MNEIHHTAIIGKNVTLGVNNKILPFTIIEGPTFIGDNNVIGPNVCIGMPGQDTRNKYYESKFSKIEIGSNNIIREFCSVQKPCYQDVTKIFNDVFLMQGVHIPHDCIISDSVVITPNCSLAGLTKVLTGANLGMLSSVNQHCVIGQYSIIATGSAVMKNVKPFSKYIPGKPLNVNLYSLKKFGFMDFENEINDYVLRDILPKSVLISNIINEFNVAHKLSKQEIYL